MINNVLNRRKFIIFNIYQYYVRSLSIAKTKQLLIDDYNQILNQQDLDLYLSIFDQIQVLEKTVVKFLTATWRWDRINNLHKAVLIVGAFEIINNIADKPVIINEMLNFIHIYDPEDLFQFINKILDKIST